MTETTNYKLVKPDYGEDADIAVINSNMDKIDEQLKAEDELIHSIGLIYDAEMQGMKVALTGGGTTPGGGSGGGGSEYVLPAATANRLGGVKIGKGVNVEADGTISSDYNSLPTVSPEEIDALFEGGE